MASPVQDKEERIQAAIAALHAQKVPSIRQAAILFSVPQNTLTERFCGRRKANKSSKQQMQRLTPEEADSLAQAIDQLDARGPTMSKAAVESLARQMLVAKGDTKPLGGCWYYNFLARHPQLKDRRARARAAAPRQRAAASPASCQQQPHQAPVPDPARPAHDSDTAGR